MFIWTITDRLAKKGNPNAHQLSLGAKLSYPVAVRVLKNDPMARIDAETAGKLAVYFGVTDPRRLFAWQKKAGA